MPQTHYYVSEASTLIPKALPDDRRYVLQSSKQWLIHVVDKTLWNIKETEHIQPEGWLALAELADYVSTSAEITPATLIKVEV